jgi:hypothetical protein
MGHIPALRRPEMSFFGKSRKAAESNKAVEEAAPADAGRMTSLYDSPRICAFDLTAAELKSISDSRFNVFGGSLGSIVRANNTPGHGHFCLVNSLVPPNLHEFEILIIDLCSRREVPYDVADHTKKSVKDKDDLYLYCQYPKNIFDPRPFAAAGISKTIAELQKKESILIVFADSFEEVEYEVVANDGGYARIKERVTYDNYSFMPNRIHYHGNRLGRKINVVPELKLLSDLARKYFSKADYRITFYHPTTWDGKKNAKSRSFVPIALNDSDEIVSFAEKNDRQWTFIFPNVEDKASFLLDMLNTFLPDIMPGVFPLSQRNAWLNAKEYYLPKQEEVLGQIDLLEETYKAGRASLDDRLKEIKKEYSFLHQLLTATGDELVQSLIKYLRWLGFDNVVDMDKEHPEKKEEDIQIELQNGLLIIEAKGLGGTSKDEECSQVAKFRYRRCEERGKLDVSALYIVNHQRHLPAADRTTPPFTPDQIREAVSDKRGLLTTFRLFNLYFEVEAGIIDRNDAMLAFGSHGLIEFDPKGFVSLGKIQKTFRDGRVIILSFAGITVRVGDQIVIRKNQRLLKTKVESIQMEGKDVVEVKGGEVGIMTSLNMNAGQEVLVRSINAT